MGDPLFTMKAKAGPRTGAFALPPDFHAWTRVEAGPVPRDEAGDEEKLDWVYASALAENRTSAIPGSAAARLAILLRVRRERLHHDRLPFYDALLIDLLAEPRYASLVREKLVQVPLGAQTPLLRRRLETLRTAELEQAIAVNDLGAAASAWSELIESDLPISLAKLLTARVAAIASTPKRLLIWRDYLRYTLQMVRSLPAALILEQELRRLEDSLGL
jgi:hypothetical protein